MRIKFRKLLKKKTIVNLTFIKFSIYYNFSKILTLISETSLYRKKLVLKFLFQNLFILIEY